MSFINQFLIPYIALILSTTEKIQAPADELDGGCIEVNYQWVVTNTSPKPVNATTATGGSCSGSYSYQWQISYDDVYYTNVVGATSQNLNYSGTITQTTYFLRRTTCGSEVKYTNSIKMQTASQVFYNTAKSGNFSRNNCPSPNFSAPIPYSVPAQKYSSPVSGDADIAATYELNTVGQWNANVLGVCCSLTLNVASGVMVQNQTITLLDSTVSFAFAVGWPGSITSLNIGTLNGDCIKPIATRTIPFMSGSATLEAVITSSGSVTVYLISGTLSPGYFSVNGKYNIKVPGFYSAFASGSYARNNCPVGQVGSSVTYNVQSYKYFSIVNQATANALATSEVSANGQSYANTNGTCTQINQITGNNSKSVGYGVQFLNNATSIAYNFSLSGSSSNVILGNIPSGTYKVTFMPTGGPSTTANFTVGSSSQYGMTSAVFTNISITSNTSVYVN